MVLVVELFVFKICWTTTVVRVPICDLNNSNRYLICDTAVLCELDLNETNNDDEPIENDSDDCEEDILEQDLQLSDMEDIEAAEYVNENVAQEADKQNSQFTDEDEVPLARLYFTRGKNKTRLKWKLYLLQSKVCTSAHNIIMHLPGSVREARTVNTEIQCFELFVDDSIIETLTCTNIFIESRKALLIMIWMQGLLMK